MKLLSDDDLKLFEKTIERARKMNTAAMSIKELLAQSQNLLSKHLGTHLSPLGQEEPILNIRLNTEIGQFIGCYGHIRQNEKLMGRYEFYNLERDLSGHIKNIGPFATIIFDDNEVLIGSEKLTLTSAFPYKLIGSVLAAAIDTFEHKSKGMEITALRH
jgi:hypothetical protein